VLSQASVDVTDATEVPLKQACDLLDSFMALFLLAPLLVPALWLAIAGCCSQAARTKDRRSSAPAGLRKLSAPQLPGGQPDLAVQMAPMSSNPAYEVEEQCVVPNPVHEQQRERSSTFASCEARKDPESLVGQRVDVPGKGEGMVTGLQKATGKSTMHLILFDTTPTATPEAVLLQKETGGKGRKFYIISETGAD
jgi:hypothetical protein